MQGHRLQIAVWAKGQGGERTRKEQNDRLERVKQECERLAQYPCQCDDEPVLVRKVSTHGTVDKSGEEGGRRTE